MNARKKEEEKLEVLQKENKKLVSQLCGFILFARRISEELEKTKQWFKSKKIAEIREDIEKKIVEILTEGEDIELLNLWTKEWGIKKLYEIKEKSKEEHFRPVK